MSIYHCRQNGMFFRQRGKLVVNSDDMTTDQKHCARHDHGHGPGWPMTCLYSGQSRRRRGRPNYSKSHFKSVTFSGGS